jgi:DNA-binding NtrC family response regulator
VAEPPGDTWKEESDSRPDASVLLTVVLRYEQLVGGSSSSRLLFHECNCVEIGRAETDRWASARHAEIARQGVDAHSPVDTIRDVGSRNGTFVNGTRLSGPQRLADGDLIEIGHTLFVYRKAAPELARRIADDPLRIGPTVTRCPAVAALALDLARIAPTGQSVLITGETGSGKEIVARTVHEASARQGPFVTLDCGAIPESLVEGTLFGYRRGAFTGASEARVGEIVRADGGTLFLDELTNMPLGSQSKLLRVMETGVVTPLGTTDSRKVDVRWIGATNRPNLTDEDALRSDILRRIAGYVARLPPLRERREDLGALASHLLSSAGIERAAITARAGRALFSGSFPGNIRQLRTTLYTAAVLAGERPIDLQHLAASEVASAAETPTPERPPPPASRRSAPDREAIVALLSAAQGNVQRAAERLHVHPRQLYRWIERYALDLRDYRS